MSWWAFLLPYEKVLPILHLDKSDNASHFFGKWHCLHWAFFHCFGHFYFSVVLGIFRCFGHFPVVWGIFVSYSQPSCFRVSRHGQELSWLKAASPSYPASRWAGTGGSPSWWGLAGVDIEKHLRAALLHTVEEALAGVHVEQQQLLIAVLPHTDEEALADLPVEQQ